MAMGDDGGVVGVLVGGAQPLEQIDSLLSPVLVRGRLIRRRRRLLPSAIGHRQVLMRVKKKAVPLSRDCQQLTKLEQIGVGFRKFETYFHWASSRTTLIILRFSPRDSTNHVHSIRCLHSMYLSFERCSLTQIAVSLDQRRRRPHSPLIATSNVAVVERRGRENEGLD